MLNENFVIQTANAPRNIAMGCRDSNIWMIKALDHIYYCTFKPFHAFARVDKGKESKLCSMNCLKSFIKGECDKK